MRCGAQEEQGQAKFTFKPSRSRNASESGDESLGRFVALYDYAAQRSDELSFAQGSLLYIFTVCCTRTRMYYYLSTIVLSGQVNVSSTTTFVYTCTAIV